MNTIKFVECDNKGISLGDIFIDKDGGLYMLVRTPTSEDSFLARAHLTRLDDGNIYSDSFLLKDAEDEISGYGCFWYAGPCIITVERV